MANFVTIFILLIIAISISKITKIKIEEAMPISVIGIALPIYICGLFDNLKVGIYGVALLILFSICTIVYFIIKEKSIKLILKQCLTPGILVYILFYIINILANKNRILENYDEFNHWGLIIKNMYIYNKFGMHENSVVTFNEYPPFTAIFQYLFLSVQKMYSESTIITAQNMLYISMIMPIFKEVSWKNIKKIFITIPVILCPLVLYPDFFKEILADGFMGVMFAMGLYQIYQKNSKVQNILLLTYISTLSLTKTTGIVLAIALALAKLINMIINKENKKDIGKFLLALLIPIVLTGAWYLKLSIYKANTNWDFEKVYLQSANSTENSKAIIENFQEAFFGKKNYLTEKKLGTWLCVFIYMAYTICLYSKISQDKKKSYKVCSIFMSIFTLIYILGMLWMYLTIFNFTEAGILASYERYVGTIILASFLFNTYILIEVIEAKLSNILLIISVLLVFLPFQTIEKDYFREPSTEVTKYENILKYKNIFSEEDKVYYLGYSSMEERYALALIKYKMMPITTNNIHLEYKTDNQEFYNKLIENGYTYLYLYRGSKSLEKEYNDAFENEKISDDSLYKIVENNGKIYFRKIEI